MTNKQLREKIEKEIEILHNCWLEDDYDTTDPDAQSTIKKLLDLIEQEKKNERLDFWHRFISIHDKYPDDDTDSDRLFRNDFMSEFSKFIDETTEQLQSKKGDR